MAGDTVLIVAPDAAAYAFRASLTLHRLVVGALGFLAFAALLRGRQKPAAGLAVAAALYALLASAAHAGTSIPATLLTIAIAGALAGLIASWPAPHGRLTRVVLAGAVLAGCFAITNFLHFHDWRSMGANGSPEGRFGAIHYHDMFHYYLGAKYYPELSYDGLYACAAQAATEQGLADPGWPARDLRTNEIVTVGAILPHGAACRSRFSDDRWRAYSRDVADFFEAVDASARVRYLTDFGYNATPFLTALHRPLVAWTSPTPVTLGALASIDALLFALCIGLIAWAFGPAAAALTAFAWGVGVMWVYDHVGLPGSLGRLWWIGSIVAAICLARRGWFTAAGVGLATAAALRGFPGVFLAWPMALATWHYLRTRTLPTESRRLLAGAIAGLAMFGAVSAIGVDPWDAYGAFLHNSWKHATSGLSNFMGLMPMLGEGRENPAWWLLGSALAALTAMVCRRLELPAALALSGIVGMFVLFPLTNYDYVALVLLVPFMLERPGRGMRSDLLAFAACVLLGNLVFIVAPGADLFTYTVDSAIVLLTLGFFLVRWGCELYRPHPA